MNKEQIADLVISFELDAKVNDTELAFGSKLTVEKIHQVKNQKTNLTEDELHQLVDFISYY
ncbi:MAG: LBP_cg2779 family protein [Lactobacillus sp.]|nr:LBP_cg2779 family protein [Lactobacillus sp.]